jgi:hypothetical protein
MTCIDELKARVWELTIETERLDGENQALEAERDYWRTTANKLIGIKSKVQELETAARAVVEVVGGCIHEGQCGVRFELVDNLAKLLEKKS